jgi:D-inositol-3-phosphate glycosyltransferase
MNARPVILHLVDDATAGGVMRVVEFIRTSADMATFGEHRVLHVKRGKLIAKPFDADILVSHLAVSWRSLPALLAMRASNASKPFLHIEHSYTEAFVALNVQNKRRFAALLKVSFSIFDHIIAVSEAQAEWIKSRGLCAPQKITTIQSCVNLKAFRNLTAPHGPVRVFGAIGRLDFQKGFDSLIVAFRACQNPELRLHIFGEGDQEPMLRKLAGDDERIVFRGFAADPVTALAQVDAVVMPSRWEAYGLVAIETLSAGRHLICADIDGLNDHVRGGAMVFRRGSINDLKQVMTDLVADKDAAGNLSPYRQGRLLEERFLQGWAETLDLIGNRRVAVRA